MGNMNVPASSPITPAQDPKRNISQQQEVQKVADATQKSPSVKPQDSQEQSVRPLNNQDLNKMLISMQKPTTPENMHILMTMLSHGVEASAEAFDVIEQFSKNKKKGNKLEASIISYAKGLGANPKAVNLISEFLSRNMQLSADLLKFLQRMEKFNDSLANYRSVLNPELFAGISLIVSDFLKEIRDFKKRADKFDVKALLAKESTMVQDLKYLQEFIKGLQHNLSSKNMLLAEDLQKLLSRVLADSESLHDVLITQLVLSKNPQNTQIADNFFHYWMIPNPFVHGARVIDLLISKDPSNLKNINPDKTKLVLKCETESLGTMTIVVDISDQKMTNKVYCDKELTQKYVADYTPELRKSMAAISYDLLSVKTYKRFHLEKLLFPKFDLNSIQRINTEV